MDLFFVLKMKLDARSCIPKKNAECGVISKNTLKDMETIRFRSSEWWHIYNWNCRSNDIFGPRPHIQFNHQPMETLVWRYLTAAGIYCKVLPSADSFLLVCHFLFLPRKYSSAILMLHFGQLWQAASGSWRQDRDYPKHMSTFSVKKFHYRTLEWPVCV